MLKSQLILILTLILLPLSVLSEELEVEPMPIEDVEESFQPGAEPEPLSDDFEVQKVETPQEEVFEAPPTESKPEPAPRAPVKIRKDVKLGPSRKIYDWKNHKGETAIRHPFAQKGLIRINRERHYFYKMEPSEQKRAASLRFGSFYPQYLENPDQAGQAGSTFDENYDQTDNPMVLFDYEWQLWRAPIGKLGLKAGTGLYLAQGNGHFVSGVNAGLPPRETFTFITIPINLGGIYRFHFGKSKQLFVPYGEGGGTVFGFSEFRDDDKGPKFGGALGAYFGGGLAVNLTYFDYLSRVNLDREYGINAVYLNLEYRNVVSLSESYDFSSDLINGGFTMEF